MSGIIAFDTSNYTTSAAYLDMETGRGANVSRLLPVAQGALGLRQSDAVFAHVKAVPEIIEELCINDIYKTPDIFAASNAPRSAEDSYMPCFLVGMTMARSMASAARRNPCFFSHQQGHIAAAVYSAKRMDLLCKPFLAWHLSGGTTELLIVKPDSDYITSETIIGGTSDISAGQFIDRAGVALGLKFPCGRELSDIAEINSDEEYYKIRTKDSCFSLSGMENQVKEMLAQNKSREKIANFVLNTVIYAVTRATQQALEKYPGLPVLCAGGVSSNLRFRKVMKNKFDAYFAEPSLSTDNAMGVAVLAAIRNYGRIPMWTL